MFGVSKNRCHTKKSMGGGERERERKEREKGVREQKKGRQLLDSNQIGSYFHYILTCKVKPLESTIFVLLIIVSLEPRHSINFIKSMNETHWPLNPADPKTLSIYQWISCCHELINSLMFVHVQLLSLTTKRPD